jgi:predicted CXXCH cytochrome family protein
MKAATLKVAIAVLVSLPLVTSAAPVIEKPTTIRDSKHNFQRAVNNVRVADSTQEDGLCVFCHTPHKGNSTLLLWNRQYGAASYTWKDVTGGNTTNGTPLPTNLREWDGSSRKCLSCHDGTVSIGEIMWSNAGKPATIGMTGPDVNANGALNNPTYVIPKFEDRTDLSGNHPVGVPYPYGQTAGVQYNGITSKITVNTLSKWAAFPDQAAVPVKIFGAGGGGAPSNSAAGIECASCHDPHGTGNEFFLRVTKANSALCLTCHLK